MALEFDLGIELRRTKAIDELGKSAEHRLRNHLFPPDKTGGETPTYWAPINTLVERFIRATDAADLELKRSALQTIGRLARNNFALANGQKQRITEKLQQVLDNDDDALSVESTIHAGRKFGMFDDVDGVKRLIELLRSESPAHVTVRPVLIEALEDAGPDAASAAVPVLIDLLADTDDRVQLQAVRGLGWLEDDALQVEDLDERR